MSGRIEIDQERCKGCEVCISFCPLKLIGQADKLNSAGYLPAAFLDQGKCTGCTNCATVCPEVAIEVFRD